MQSRDHSGVTFTQLNITVFNVYLKTSDYTEKNKTFELKSLETRHLQI